MYAYSQEDYKILEESLFQMLDKLWNIAKTNGKSIKGVAYNPHKDISGLWMRMLSYQTIKGVWFEQQSIKREDYVKSLDDTTVNVLFVNQKILNASPKAELIKAENFDNKMIGKFDYIMTITDDALLSLLATDSAADYLIDKWCFHHS